MQLVTLVSMLNVWKGILFVVNRHFTFVWWASALVISFYYTAVYMPFFMGVIMQFLSDILFISIYYLEAYCTLDTLSFTRFEYIQEGWLLYQKTWSWTSPLVVVCDLSQCLGEDLPRVESSLVSQTETAAQQNQKEVLMTSKLQPNCKLNTKNTVEQSSACVHVYNVA